MTDEDIVAEEPLSATELCVRYTGTSHFRSFSRKDFGTEGDPNDQLVWTPGSEHPYELFLSYAGSHQRAAEVLEKCEHEFKLVGPGSENFYAALGIEGEEEFSIEGMVED